MLHSYDRDKLQEKSRVVELSLKPEYDDTSQTDLEITRVPMVAVNKSEQSPNLPTQTSNALTTSFNDLKLVPI